MALLSFAKYHGSGNDFVLFDNRDKSIKFDAESIQKICHRRFGIGADGVILLECSEKSDYKMRIFNADGSEAESCGNGLCCFTAYLRDLHEGASRIEVETISGVIEIELKDNCVVIRISHFVPIETTHMLPFLDKKVHYINTGVPHAVIFVEDVSQIDIKSLGSKIRHASIWGDQGTNVDFATVHKEGYIKFGTYERGVEAETLSCGTGATAVALVAMRKFELASPITLQSSGGLVRVAADVDSRGYRDVLYYGSATGVFSGTIDRLTVEVEGCELEYQKR